MPPNTQTPKKAARIVKRLYDPKTRHIITYVKQMDDEEYREFCLACGGKRPPNEEQVLGLEEYDEEQGPGARYRKVNKVSKTDPQKRVGQAIDNGEFTAGKIPGDWFYPNGVNLPGVFKSAVEVYEKTRKKLKRLLSYPYKENNRDSQRVPIDLGMGNHEIGAHSKDFEIFARSTLGTALPFFKAKSQLLVDSVKYYNKEEYDQEPKIVNDAIGLLDITDIKFNFPAAYYSEEVRLVEDEKSIPDPTNAEGENWLEYLRENTEPLALNVFLDSSTLPIDPEQRKWFKRLVQSPKFLHFLHKRLFSHHTVNTASDKRGRKSSRKENYIYGRYWDPRSWFKKAKPANQHQAMGQALSGKLGGDDPEDIQEGDIDLTQWVLIGAHVHVLTLQDAASIESEELRALFPRRQTSVGTGGAVSKAYQFTTFMPGMEQTETGFGFIVHTLRKDGSFTEEYFDANDVEVDGDQEPDILWCREYDENKRLKCITNYKDKNNKTTQIFYDEHGVPSEVYWFNEAGEIIKHQYQNEKASASLDIPSGVQSSSFDDKTLASVLSTKVNPGFFDEDGEWLNTAFSAMKSGLPMLTYLIMAQGKYQNDLNHKKRGEDFKKRLDNLAKTPIDNNPTEYVRQYIIAIEGLIYHYLNPDNEAKINAFYNQLTSLLFVMRHVLLYMRLGRSYEEAVALVEKAYMPDQSPDAPEPAPAPAGYNMRYANVNYGKEYLDGLENEGWDLTEKEKQDATEDDPVAEEPLEKEKIPPSAEREETQIPRSAQTSEAGNGVHVSDLQELKNILLIAIKDAVAEYEEETYGNQIGKAYLELKDEPKLIRVKLLLHLIEETDDPLIVLRGLQNKKQACEGLWEKILYSIAQHRSVNALSNLIEPSRIESHAKQYRKYYKNDTEQRSRDDAYADLFDAALKTYDKKAIFSGFFTDHALYKLGSNENLRDDLIRAGGQTEDERIFKLAKTHLNMHLARLNQLANNSWSAYFFAVKTDEHQLLEKLFKTYLVIRGQGINGTMKANLIWQLSQEPYFGSDLESGRLVTTGLYKNDEFYEEVCALCNELPSDDNLFYEIMESMHKKEEASRREPAPDEGATFETALLT